MPVFNDSRGYSYVGNQIIGANDLEFFGNIQHDSTTNGASTSELGTALNNVLGAGKWGIAADIAGSWGTSIKDFGPTRVHLLWTPATEVGRPAIDVVGYNPAAGTGIQDPDGGSYMFAGVCKRTVSEANDMRVDTSSNNDNSSQISPQSNFFRTMYDRDFFWASVTPTSVGIYGADADGGNGRFYYQCILEGNFLSAPRNRYTFTSSGSFTDARRPQLQNTNFITSCEDTDAVYSSSLALFPNSTGDPYLTPFYAIDDDNSDGIGEYPSVIVGLCPELYIYHSSNINRSDVLNMADLNVSGNYVLGTLDDSDATHAICVANLSGGRRLMMRVGNA